MTDFDNFSKITEIIESCESQAVPDDEIDITEIPAETDFSGYQFGNKRYFDVRPAKTQVSIRLNTMVVDHLKSMGTGWQTRLNDFLMKAVSTGQL